MFANSIPVLQDSETLPQFLLSLCYGLCGFFLMVLLHVRRRYFRGRRVAICVKGWLTVPVMAIVTSLAVRHIRRRYCMGVDLFYPVLLASNVLFLVVSTPGLHWFQFNRALSEMEANGVDPGVLTHLRRFQFDRVLSDGQSHLWFFLYHGFWLINKRNKRLLAE